MDNIEPIRRVFRDAGLYHHAADDLLCSQLADAAAPPAALPDAVLVALRFYADPARYRGSNQKPPAHDPYTPEGYPYMIDVTRDGGRIASEAIAAINAVQGVKP